MMDTLGLSSPPLNFIFKYHAALESTADIPKNEKSLSECLGYSYYA
jgi:hypothetical protein